MISRHEFPYLQSLVINDAYAVRNLTVPVFQVGEEFKHLILTGRNGSGKTTVLSSLVNNTRSTFIGNAIEGNADKVATYFLKESGYANPAIHQQRRGMIIAYFPASRSLEISPVHSVTRGAGVDDLATYSAVTNGKFVPAFMQYLVNKKVFQVFETMEGQKNAADLHEAFFLDFEKQLRVVFSEPELKLIFIKEQFTFVLQRVDGTQLSFNQLSAGFSALLNILMDLLMRTDLLRKQANDYTYDPCGFVLIDEPETHLHLEMQYQILPLLTGLFPNLQFIVATHSPAVASSIKNATVFDLSTGQATGDQAAGSSYSELMQTHFGVEEYSNVADAIIKRINELVQEPDKAEARRQLQALLISEGRYMSPALRLEVEAQLIGLEE